MTLHVTFRVGNARYVVPAAEVLHLESYETATHVPGAPAYVAGLVQVRGRLVPVVDLRIRFGLPAIEHTIDRRVVVVQAGTRVAGLLVDSAREVLQIDDAAFEHPPELVERQTAGFVKAVATVAKRLFLLIDIPRVLGEELRP
ncbi:MAG TPA: chemotaxis protein CheW [Kofleriaceae bacterium]|jgi:purine-binding chemotaxis protein CheW|nr:chemotaxis protein CheW [Kofleriaceae bacterium]